MATIQSISDTNQTTTAQSSAQSSNSNFAAYIKVPTSLYDIFQKASQTYNVPLNLLMAVGKTESNFRTDAVSSHGAQGVMQLMPATAAELGVTNSFDPEQNIMGGAKYLSQMLEKFNGNTTLACAAYNAGANNVTKYSGVPPFKETQNYVKIIADYMNQGVTAPTDILTNTSANSMSQNIVSKGIESTSPSTETALEELFSYDDYLRFLDIYLNQILNINTSSSNDSQESELENSYAYQNIKYNKSVLNLLKNSETI